MLRCLVVASWMGIAASPSVAQTPLQPLVDAAGWHGTVTLEPGIYDDAEPVLIRSDMLIVGPPDAVVHSEIQVYGGATVEFRGFTFSQNKPGAAMRTGRAGPLYSQNAHIKVRSAQLWFTDVQMRCEKGATQHKAAIEVISGAVNFRALNLPAAIHYEHCQGPALHIYYGSYMALFGFSEENIVEVVSGSRTVAVNVASSTLVANGTHFQACSAVDPACEPAPVGINLARASSLIFGSGQRTVVSGFPKAYNVVEGSSQWVGLSSRPR